MKIELSSPTLLKISWPLYDSQIESEIKRRLATVPGIEAGRGREAWAPVIQLQRLIELYPKASYDYMAISMAEAVALRFWTSLRIMGVQFGFDESGNVCGISDNVSPLLQQLIHERSHALKPFVLEPAPVLRVEQPAITHLYPKPKRPRAKKERVK